MRRLIAAALLSCSFSIPPVAQTDAADDRVLTHREQARII
jgi:hypothetical protein